MELNYEYYSKCLVPHGFTPNDASGLTLRICAQTAKTNINEQKMF